jgi:hypothetical protein
MKVKDIYYVVTKDYMVAPFGEDLVKKFTRQKK